MEEKKSNLLGSLLFGSGGGGGGTGNGVLVVNITESGGVYTADKTAGEIKASLQSGIPVTIPYVVIDTSTPSPLSNFFLCYVGSDGRSANNYNGTLQYAEPYGYVLFLGELICGTDEPLVLIAATESDYPTSAS